jgi:hypothetical protein
MIVQVYEELHKEVQPLDRLKWLSHSTVHLKSKHLFMILQVYEKLHEEVQPL